MDISTQIEQLLEFKKFYEKGILTKEELESEKQKILSSNQEAIDSRTQMRLGAYSRTLVGILRRAEIQMLENFYANIYLKLSETLMYKGLGTWYMLFQHVPKHIPVIYLNMYYINRRYMMRYMLGI